MQDKHIEQLIKKSKCRNAEAFSELIHIISKDMYRIAIAVLLNEEDAADAIQDAILKCWENLGTLKKLEYFKTWMTRILLNCCYDIRKNRLDTTENIDIHEKTRCDNYNLEFKEAISGLEEKYRQVIVMYYCEEYKISEIAKILRVTPGAVKTRLHRGRKLLEEYYKAEDQR